MDVQIFPSNTELPEYFYYQAMALGRVMWGESDEYNIDLGVAAPAQHLVIAQGKRLISYASIVRVPLEVNGTTYQCLGLGGVMTFPHFRKRGYGTQLVQAATQLIREDTSADIALLWAEPANHRLYAKHGWEVMPHLITLEGNATSPEPYTDEPAMMLFLSEKGKSANFERASVYVGEEKW